MPFREKWQDVHLFHGPVIRTINTPVAYVGDWQEAIVDIEVGAVSGTTPTLTPEILVSGISGDFKHRRTMVDLLTEGDLGRVTAPTVEGRILASGLYHCHICCAIGTRMMLRLEIGGTNPSFYVDVWLHLK